MFLNGFQLDPFFEKIIFFIVNILPIIVVGVVLGNIIEGWKLTDKISILSKPFVKAGNLPKEAGIAIVAILASGHASYSILSNFQKQNKISDDEVVVTMIISNLFGYLGHLPTFYIPIVLPILGLKTGGIYIIIQLTTALVITLLGVFYGKIKLKGTKNLNRENLRDKEKRSVKKSIKISYSTLKNILPKITIFYLISISLYYANLFEPIKKYIDPLLKFLGISVESTAIILTKMVDTTASLAIAGGLLKEGALSSLETIIALLIGSLFSFLFVFIKFALPNYLAYFGKKTGFKVALYNLILNLSVTILAITLLITIFY